MLEFDAPIAEYSGTTLILVLSDQERKNSSGADQKTNTISFMNVPQDPLTRKNGHLWMKWNLGSECVAL